MNKHTDAVIDHSIDVRNEPDVIKAFNKFIKKWCGSNYSHLIDTDEQDGQFMRDKLTQARLDAATEARREVIEEIQEYLIYNPAFRGKVGMSGVIKYFDSLKEKPSPSEKKGEA